MNTTSNDIPDQEDGSQPTSLRNRLLKRILPLLLLGSAIALIIVQLTGAITYKTILRLELVGSLRADLKTLEILVEDPSNRDDVISTAVFHFDATHRPALLLVHILNLTRGEYSILFKMFAIDGSILQSRRELEVSADLTTIMSLP